MCWKGDKEIVVLHYIMDDVFSYDIVFFLAWVCIVILPVYYVIICTN
jgi:hypothetical protein